MIFVRSRSMSSKRGATLTPNGFARTVTIIATAGSTLCASEARSAYTPLLHGWLGRCSARSASDRLSHLSDAIKTYATIGLTRRKLESPSPPSHYPAKISRRAARVDGILPFMLFQLGLCSIGV